MTNINIMEPVAEVIDLDTLDSETRQQLAERIYALAVDESAPWVQLTTRTSKCQIFVMSSGSVYINGIIRKGAEEAIKYIYDTIIAMRRVSQKIVLIAVP